MTTASSSSAAAATLVDDDDMLDRHGVAACWGLCLLPIKGRGGSGRVGGAQDDRREREGNEQEHAGAELLESHVVRTWTRCLRRTNAAWREIVET
jgi:hypothetical protein